MRFIADLVGSLAWPVTALSLGLYLIRELKAGLLQRIMEGLGSLKVAGVLELTRQAVQQASQAAEEADIPIIEVASDESVDESDADRPTPYETVMESWTALAIILTELSVRYGGKDDQRCVRENLQLLIDRQVIDAKFYEAVRSLQQARNGIRRSGEGSVGPASADDYVKTTRSVIAALKRTQNMDTDATTLAQPTISEEAPVAEAPS